MGRPKNKKNQAKWRHPKGQKNKRAKQERFWIEDCKETKVPEGKSSQMEVLITRIELTDDYRQVPKPADKESEEKADISASKEQQLEGEGDTRETLGAHDGEKKGAPSSEVKKEELPSAKMQPNVEDDAAATGEAKRDTNQKEADDTTKTAQPLDDAATTIDSRSLEEETSIKELTSEKTSEKLDICVKRSRNAKVPLKKVSPTGQLRAGAQYLNLYTQLTSSLHSKVLLCREFQAFAERRLRRWRCESLSKKPSR
jgi:hypothetical protein